MKLAFGLMMGLLLLAGGCGVTESNREIVKDKEMKEAHEAKLSVFEGAVVRGPKDEKVMSFVFTGGSFGEGMPYILDTLKKHEIKGAFFFTGDFLENAEFEGYVKQAYAEGHYVGPHSYGHPLYCDWGDRNKTLISREDFEADFEKNLKLIEDKYEISRSELKWWIPPYEHYNKEVAGWAEELGYPMFNLTYGTLTHADYTLADAKNYRDSETIWNSVFEYEAKHDDGLNGWIMLIHAGAGDGRPDKFFLKLDDLINELKDRGYSFKRVDELIDP